METTEANRSLRDHLRLALRSELTRVWLPAVLLLTLLIGGMSVFLSRSQDQSRDHLEQRYVLRVTLASDFVAAYVADIQKREKVYATEFLAGRVVAPERFALVSSAFGFDSAVLLDSRGRVLDIVPAKPALIGARLDESYPHLRAALTGIPAVSDVVPSAAQSLPIVELAVPFDTPTGLRVFSGGTQIERSPLAAFLADSLPYPGARSYVIDAEGFVMVAGGSRAVVLEPPPDAQGTRGAIVVAGTEYRFVSLPIANTTWHLLAVTPSAQLFAPLSGRQHWAPWLVLVAFALAAAAALGLLSRLLRHRRELAHLATHDPLTGALNRRTLERVFQRMSAAALRAESAVGVLAIDLDHFKDVNDTYGHAAGDELLRRVAETLWLVVRPSDVVARIGGDEFVVLLGEVSEQQAQEVAARVFAALDESPFPLGSGVEIRAVCSIGVALATADDVVDSVLARADGALYQAKAVGRNVSAVMTEPARI